MLSTLLHHPSNTMDQGDASQQVVDNLINLVRSSTHSEGSHKPSKTNGL